MSKKEIYNLMDEQFSLGLSPMLTGDKEMPPGK